MKNSILFFLIGVATLSCTIKVNSAYNPKTDFTKYNSFCWLKGCEFRFTGPAYLKAAHIQEQFQNAIIDEMKKKGVRYDNDNPDLLMDVHVIMETDTAYAYYLPGGDTYVLNFTGSDQIILLKGTLVIDLVDNKTSQMVWRSTAVSYFDTHPEVTDKNFRKGIAKALKDFTTESKRKTNENH